MNIKELLGSQYKEDMTSEELIAALENVELEDERQKLKDAISKANKEAAEYKRQLKEKLTADEIKEQEEQAAKEELQNAYNKLLKENTINKNTAKFIALGYDEKIALETAEALFDGNLDKVFENHKKFNADFEAKIKTELIDSTPKPQGGGIGIDAITKQDLQKMSVSDRTKFAQENPDRYREIYTQDGGID